MNTLKIGDHCLIVHSLSGLDEGKRVEIIGYFNPKGGVFEDYVWAEGQDVIVKALDSPLHSVNQMIYLVAVHTSRPYASKWLMKLPEVKAEDEELELELEVVR